MSRKQIAASKFGATPNMSGAKNSSALTSAFASIDDDTTIYFRPETYALDDPVRILRSDVTADGVLGTVFEYTSHYAGGAVEGGQAWLVGRIAEASEPQIEHVALSDFTVRDLNTVDHPTEGDVGHLSSSIEIFGCEDAVVDGITFDGSKGNGALNVLGRSINNFETRTKRVTVQGCRWIGEHQGDGMNIGGVAHADVLDNQLPFGGVRRHFFEGGTAQRTVTLRGNRVNMNGQGFACWGSMTLLEGADASDNWWLNWSDQGAAFAVAPDRPEWSHGDILPVRGLRVVGDVFSSRAGLAAVQLLVAEVFDHEYRANLFDCLLPFYVATPNKGAVIIRGNTSRAGVKRLIAAAKNVTLDTDWPVGAA